MTPKKTKMHKYKETKQSEPQGRDNRILTLERVIEAEEAPAGAVQVPDSTPVSDWTTVKVTIPEVN